jgi:hypothetical protein
MSELDALFAQDLAAADPAQTLAAIRLISDSLESNMPPLLKKEWNRVKSGELVYRLAKWITAAFVLVMLLVTLWLVRRLWIVGV